MDSEFADKALFEKTFELNVHFRQLEPLNNDLSKADVKIYALKYKA